MRVTAQQRNIKLTIAYDGTDFCGWQKQSESVQDRKSDSSAARTVQGVIEDALFKLHGKQVNLTGSGRTDSGVHATGQAANFFTDIKNIPPARFTPALNSLLPRDVRITDAIEVHSDFHARFSAKARLYRYQFLCRSRGINTKSFNPVLPHESRYNLLLSRHPRIDLLNAYGRLLLGETDCSIFAGAKDIAVIACKSKKRYIYKAYFYIEKEKLIFEICANAFLRNMVRSAAGTFLHYEEKGTPPEKLREIIASGKRSLAGPTLPPQGLFLQHIEY